MSEVTRIIRAITSGKADATHQLLPLVYSELRQMALHRLAQERTDHTLQPTALVHEAYLRLVGSSDDSWENRAHFFGAAAEAMRRILIDHARTKKRAKRGGDAQRLELNDSVVPWLDRSDELLALDEAMQSLELLDRQKADLVKMKFFGGMTTEDAAKALGVSTRTAERHWAYARVWLCRHIAESD